jgi:ABC-type transport system involved in multi-copper enzyme maturation permease subunit
MLWYKSWLETRWRFVIGLALLMLSACSTVLIYPEVMRLLPLGANADLSGPIGRQVAESIALARDYRGYVWSQWFMKNMPQLWTIFAVLLGSGGLLAHGSRGGALFTLSLPISRTRVLSVRAATALGELLVLAIIPSLIVTLLSPAIGQRYGVGDALVHGLCLFIAGSVFFSLAFLLSTVFSDIWRPLLIAIGIAMVLGFFEQTFRDLAPYRLDGVMGGERYFRGGGLPWQGLLVSMAMSAALLYGAAVNIARRDF